MPHDLIAPGNQPTQPFGPIIRHPDLGQEAAGLKLCQDASIDLVCLDAGMRDRLHLHRIGNNDAGNEGRQHPDNRHRVARCLNDDLVVLPETAPEALEA